MPKNDIDFGFLLTLKPVQIVKYFEEKGYKFSFDWYQVWQEEHNKVFTVAKAMCLDILQDIRGAVTQAIAEGTTLEEFQKNLKPTLQKKGWWGKKYMFDEDGNIKEVQLGSPKRLQTIYETNLNVSYAKGNYNGMMDNAEDRPYWRYRAVIDPSTRDEHKELHNKVYPFDHPFWKTYYPPNDWGCRCTVDALTEEEVKAYGYKIESKMPDKDLLPPEEWAYNPAESAYEPDTKKYDKDLLGEYYKALDNE